MSFVEVAIPRFEALLVVLVRTSGILAATPVVGGRSLPVQVKVGLAVALGLVLMPILPAPSVPAGLGPMAAGLVAEFLIGLAIGLAARALFAGIELAGEVMGQQMGIGVIQLLDPLSARPTPLISHFYVILASLVFLSVNGHFLVVRAVADSFTLVPPFTAELSPALGEDVLRLTAAMFRTALQLAAPICVAVLLINLVLAVLGRAVAQLNVFVLSFPVTIAGGFLVMGAALPFTIGVFDGEFTRLADTIRALLARLGHG